MNDVFKNFIISTRPKHWIKNVLVFAAIVFSAHIFDYEYFLKSLSAFWLFIMISSGIYVINDIADKEKDKSHPIKAHRPIAAGKLSVNNALIIVIPLIVIALSSSFYLNTLFGVIALIYFLLNLAYSKYLKNIVIIDIMIISSGFVFRAVAGGFAINIQVSLWLCICTFLISLFLGFGKRRHELLLLKNEAIDHRKTLGDYSAPFLDQLISVVATSVLISYILYTMSAQTIQNFGNNNLIFTIPFVLYGLFRYIYLIYHKDEGGSPSELLIDDKPLLICVGLWIVSVIYIIY